MTDSEQTVRGSDTAMRPVTKQALHLPEISIRQPPVVGIQHSQVEHAVTLDSPRVIHVSLRITLRESARRLEERLAAMQAGITRARDGPPARLRAIDPDYMIEQVYRLEAQHERRMAVLLENGRGEQCCFETVSSARACDTSKPPHRVTSRLSIVWEIVQPSLNRERCAKLVYKSPLTRSELKCRWLNSRWIGESRSHYCFFSSIVQMSLCRSPIVK